MTTTPTRRTALRGSLAAIAAGLAVPWRSHAATTLPDADAELIRLCAEFDRVERSRIALHEGDTQIEDDDERDLAMAPLNDQQDEMAPLIWDTQASTLEGVRAKARSFALSYPEFLEDDDSWDKEFIASILRDLLEGGVA